MTLLYNFWQQVFGSANRSIAARWTITFIATSGGRLLIQVFMNESKPTASMGNSSQCSTTTDWWLVAI